LEDYYFSNEVTFVKNAAGQVIEWGFLIVSKFSLGIWFDLWW
jgi:hypothetical protein